MPDLLVFAAIVPWLCGSKVVLDVHDPMPELFKSWDQGASNRLLVALLATPGEGQLCVCGPGYLRQRDDERESSSQGSGRREDLHRATTFRIKGSFPCATRRPSWPRSTDSLVLLYCGTVTEHYDLALAVKAIARLAGEIPVKLRILGEGNRLAEVLDLASALGVRDSIESLRFGSHRQSARGVEKVGHRHFLSPGGSVWRSVFLDQNRRVPDAGSSGTVATDARRSADTFPTTACFTLSLEMSPRLRTAFDSCGGIRRKCYGACTNARDVLPRLSWQAEKGQFVSFLHESDERRKRRARWRSGETSLTT